MFGIKIPREWTGYDQDVADMMLTEGRLAALEYREAHRHSVPVAQFRETAVPVPEPPVCEPETEEHYFWRMYGGMEPVQQCPICGSYLVEDESHDMYGAVDGYTQCEFCGYHTSWADLSAII